MWAAGTLIHHILVPGFVFRGTRRLLAPIGALCVLACVLAQPTAASAAFGYLTQFGSGAPGNSQLSSPLGVATDAAGNVYVADCSLNVVKKFDANGGYLAQIGIGHGTGNGQFDCARDVAVDGANVYVVDYGNKRVERFSTAGDLPRASSRTPASSSRRASPPTAAAICSSPTPAAEPTPQISMCSGSTRAGPTRPRSGRPEPATRNTRSP